MEKDDILTTKFTDDDVDDFDMQNLGSSGADNDKSKSAKEDVNDKSDVDDKSITDKPDDKKEIDSSKKDDDIDDKETDIDDKSKKEDKSKVEDKANDVADKKDIKDEKTEKEYNIFDDFKSDVSLDDKVDFNYESTVDELGIEIEGEKPKTKKEFVELIKNTIEKSKQTLNLDEYPPEVKLILENLKTNNNLSVTDWYRNDTIRNADRFLSMSDEDKARASLRMELKSKYSGDDLKEAIDDKIADMTAEELSKKSKDASRDVLKVRNHEYDKIIKEKGEWMKVQENKDREKVNMEQKILISKVKEMKSFMNFDIPESVTNTLIKEIETGVFQKILDQNVADSKISAYLFAKLGNKINEGIKRKIDIVKSDSYKEGTDVIKKQKHNITIKSSGQQINKGTSKDLAFDDDDFKE